MESGADLPLNMICKDCRGLLTFTEPQHLCQSLNVLLDFMTCSCKSNYIFISVIVLCVKSLLANMSMLTLNKDGEFGMCIPSTVYVGPPKPDQMVA